MTKMMSSMSYSPQPEYFARSLKRRLQSLTPEGVTRTSPPIDIETDAAENGSEVIAASDISGNKENRIRKILERGLRTCDGYVVKLSPNFPATGTTFPPNRFINEDQLRAKFHSDSDFHSQLKSRRHDKADASRSAADFRHVNGEDDGDDHPAVADICDSDLFFDFDIGSPEQPDSDEDHLINHVNEIGGNDRDISPTIIGKASDLPAIMHSPDHSTAYGSTTSGIFSDQDTPSPSDVDENERLEQFVEGFSLNPEDWIKTQQAMLAKLDKSSSVTPTMSPHTRSPPASVAAAAAAASQSLEEPAMITLPPVLTPPDSNDGTLSNGSQQAPITAGPVGEGRQQELLTTQEVPPRLREGCHQDSGPFVLSGKLFVPGRVRAQPRQPHVVHRQVHQVPLHPGHDRTRQGAMQLHEPQAAGGHLHQ